MHLKNMLDVFMDLHVAKVSILCKTLLLLTFVNYCSSNAQIGHKRVARSAQTTQCPGCKEPHIPPVEFRRLKIEMIKTQILVKLRMVKPPNITDPPAKLPDALLKRLQEKDRTEHFTTEAKHAKTMEIILFPERGKFINRHILKNEKNKICLI